MSTSKYNTLEELEENVTVKKAKEEATLFYSDKSKDFEERVKVFEKYGDKEQFIYRPKNKALDVIFKAMLEYEGKYSAYSYEKYQTVDCVNIINNWVQKLRYEKYEVISIGSSRVKLDKINRNYEASLEAIERLRRIYIEKLMLEKVSSFDYNW